MYSRIKNYQATVSSSDLVSNKGSKIFYWYETEIRDWCGNFNGPNFLILDESTHGLNPDGINLVYIMNFNSSDYRTTFILVNQEQFD